MTSPLSADEQLKRRLRAIFDARIFNYGDYNCVFTAASNPYSPLLIGFRQQPLEMIFYRITENEINDDAVAEASVPAEQAEAATPEDPRSIIAVDLANIQQLADTGTGYQVATIHGDAGWFEVEPQAAVPEFLREQFGPGTPEFLNQSDDSTEFHEFMSAFMDKIESLYASTQDLSPGSRD